MFLPNFWLKLLVPFNWDLWQGPVAETGFNSIYHPRFWRGFWNYGGGTLGDWFCHIGDGPVWVLDLYEPTVIAGARQDGGRGPRADARSLQLENVAV